MENAYRATRRLAALDKLKLILFYQIEVLYVIIVPWCLDQEEAETYRFVDIEALRQFNVTEPKSRDLKSSISQQNQIHHHCHIELAKSFGPPTQCPQTYRSLPVSASSQSRHRGTMIT